MRSVTFSGRAGVLFAAGIFALMTAGARMAGGASDVKASGPVLALFHKKSSKGPAAEKIKVKGSEWQLAPAKYTVPPGKVELRLKNVGAYPHAIAIDGKGIQMASAAVDPGKEVSLVVDLSAAGEYKILCPLPGHAERGMVGTLTVKGAKASTGGYGY